MSGHDAYPDYMADREQPGAFVTNPARETEHRVEEDSGWLLDRETGATTEWDGVRIFWRFKGERRWRKRVIVADSDQGQTVASLKADVAEIVVALAMAANQPQEPTP